MSRVVLLAVLVAAGAVAVAGCGGSGSAASGVARAEVSVPAGAPAGTSDTTGSEAGTTTTSASAATSTTVAAPLFVPLFADPNGDPYSQVEAAYLRSWDVYRDAIWGQRTDALAFAYHADALRMRQDEIHRLVELGHRVRGDVDHNYTINVLDTDLAVVVDAYRNHLVLVDAATGQDLEPDPDVGVMHQYMMERIGDQWLITYVSG